MSGFSDKEFATLYCDVAKLDVKGCSFSLRTRLSVPVFCCLTLGNAFNDYSFQNFLQTTHFFCFFLLALLELSIC